MTANREEWYYNALLTLRELFKLKGYEIPAVRIGCGWPTRQRKTAAGQCWDKMSSTDETHEIFISPILDVIPEILATMIHELCHAVVGVEAKHKGPFIEVMKAMGMRKKWTDSVMGPELMLWLVPVIDKLGLYPHRRMALTDTDKKKIGSRLIKVQCPMCDYIVRVTRKHLDEKGAPICPLHDQPFQEVPPN